MYSLNSALAAVSSSRGLPFFTFLLFFQWAGSSDTLTTHVRPSHDPSVKRTRCTSPHAPLPARPSALSLPLAKTWFFLSSGMAWTAWTA